MLRSTPAIERDVLFREEAAGRAARVHDVSYELSIDLAAERETYAGRTVIDFRLRSRDEPLFVDFRGYAGRLVVNGTTVEAEQRDHRLWLPMSVLGAVNRLELVYESAFDASGDGFHRFVDPEDGETYLYTNLQPYSAHRLFPCFDQPDIKATYQLSVTAPAAWSVISAETARSHDPDEHGRRRHEFAVTPRFSSYLFPLIAGPWEHIEVSHGDTPLGLFGRRSMRADLERSAEEVLEITRQGLDYFSVLFGRAYPFAKYDQLFVPEFNAGAMENVAAVTVHDRLLFRDPPTYAQRLTRGEVILHELAHMWFGDLVTMRWWDDLWLNETFATYLSYRCLAEATGFSDAWQVFNGDMRPAAHRQDQLVTTHPVATAVEHTDEAAGNFDAITYEKGAAVIKQLVAAIGDDAFRAGLRAYCERYAWDNATLGDLLNVLGEAAGRPLDEWARLWLRSASINTLGVHWSGEAGRIAGMELRQSAPSEHPILRPHATIVGLVRRAPGQEALVIDAIPVHIDGQSVSVDDAVGRESPLFVYPNHDDHDYALVTLDPVSLAFALERLPELPDPLLRQQVWSTLWEMVRDATLPAPDYLAAVRRFAPAERDRALLQSVLERALEVLRRYLPDDRLETEAGAMVATALAAIADTHGDLRLVWTRTACHAAVADDTVRLASLADDHWSLDGIELDQEMRWLIAIKAMAYGLANAESRLHAEERRDGSDRGQRARIRAEASRSDGAAKAEAWARINGHGYGSDYRTRAAIMGFQWRHQRALLAPFRSSFYEHVPEVYARRDHAYAGAYLRWLVPDRWAEPAELERIQRLGGGLGPEQGLLRRHLDEIADDLARDIRVRAAAVSSGLSGVGVAG